MSRFDADAFLDTIRAATSAEAPQARPATTNTFDVDDFLHSIALAAQIEELEEARPEQLRSEYVDMRVGDVASEAE